MNINIREGLVALSPIQAAQRDGELVVINSFNHSNIRVVEGIGPSTAAESGLRVGDSVVINPYSESHLQQGLTVVTLGDVLGKVTPAEGGE